MTYGGVVAIEIAAGKTMDVVLFEDGLCGRPRRHDGGDLLKLKKLCNVVCLVLLLEIDGCV